MLKKLAIIGIATSIMFAPAVFAPATALAQRAPVITAAKPLKAPTVLTESAAKALECSNDAKAKGLKGKPRKKFIAQCKKNVGPVG